MAILGLIVLLICVVLFMPFRYELQGNCDGDVSSLYGRLRFSYFLHLIRGTVEYADKKLVWKLYIAWKKMDSEEDALEAVKETADEAGDILEAGFDVLEDAVEETSAAETTKEAVNISTEETTKETEAANISAAETLKETEEKKADESCHEKHQHEQKVYQSNTQKKENTSKATFTDKLEVFFKKISCKFKAVCDKIKELIRKKDIVMDFLTNEIHQKAFLKAVSEIKKLLCRMKPKRLRGTVEFGFEDPALTGKVLATASILYPYYADEMQICPQFEEKILKGNVFVKGCLAARVFAAMGIRLLLDKNIRKTIRNARAFKLD